MAYIMNMAKHPLPKEFKPTEEQIDTLRDWQRRAHLQYSAPEKGIKALTNDERKAMVEFENNERMSLTPMWNGYHFSFAEFGKQGSLFEVEDNVANHLTTKHQGIIVEVTDESQIPKGVTPIRRMNPGKTTSVLGRSIKEDIVLSAKESGQVRAGNSVPLQKGIITGDGVVPA